MVAHMKTTIEIPDPLLRRAKALAAKQGASLKELVELALRHFLESQPAASGRFTLKDCSFTGDGLQPGVSLSDWTALRASMYEGRGG
jgi:hypothetical protein